MLLRTQPRKKRAAGDGRARRALPGYAPRPPPRGGAGARLASGAVRGRGPRASPPAGPAAVFAVSGSRPWPSAPGAQPPRLAPRPGPPTEGRPGPRQLQPLRVPLLGLATPFQSLTRSRSLVSSFCPGRRERARARSGGGGGVRGWGARAPKKTRGWVRARAAGGRESRRGKLGAGPRRQRALVPLAPDDACIRWPGV